MLMKNNRLYIILSLTMFFVLSHVGCTENTVHITMDDIIEALKKDSIEKSRRIELSFTAKIDERNIKTRSGGIKPFPEDCYMQLYIYNEDDYPGNGSWLYMGVFKADEDGFVKSVYASPKLSAGTYNFYATGASRVNYNQGPTINQSTGLSTSLSNGIDYLWWKEENVEIDSDNSEISILFQHICAKIELEMEAVSGHTIDSINQVSVILGDQSQSVLSLNTGVVKPATSLNTSYGQIATIDDFDADLYMLPLQTKDCLIATISATIDDKDQKFIFKIPPPVGDFFESNIKYEYEIILGEYLTKASGAY